MSERLPVVRVAASPIRGRWRPVVLLLAILFAAPTPQGALGEQAPPVNSAGGSSEAAEWARAYIDGFVQRERLKAGNALLENELERLEAALEPGSPTDDLLAELHQTDAETRQTLVQVLEGNAEPVVHDLNDALEELDRQISHLKADWLAVRTSLNDARFLLFRVKGGRRVAGQLASLLSVDKRWFWLFGLVAVATLVGLVFHDRRHELRRMLNGGRARKMGLSKFLTAALVILAILTLTTFLMGDRIYEALLSVGSGQERSPRASIVEQTAAIEAEIEALRERRQELAARHEPVQDQYRSRLTEALPQGSRIPLRWRQFRARVLELTEAVALLERLPQAIEADRANLGALSRESDAQTEDAVRYLYVRQWVRGGLGLALVGLAVTGGFLYRRGVKARRDLTARTCPLCLRTGRLERVPEHARRSGVPGGVNVVRCKNVISREPYDECDYTFMDVYRTMSKVCFPTLGVPQAGKTHWLTMLYWELNRGNFPRSVQFERIKSQSSEDFDMIVEEILTSRIGTAATQRERIPHPLVFNFRDRDPLGRSNVLVNIFDYSGEVTSDMGVDDYRRRRALDADGYFFFLDPTYPSEPQANALADFREDIRLVKGVRAGKRIRSPVALCVSKIDVVAGQPYALPDGGDAIAKFYGDLGEIDPTGDATALEVIEARSRRTAELRDTIWPGWQIERQIHDLFGGRYLFFPLTPVGLDGRGETDLSLRTISPFGLLEPLLWLLQMNGYPILE